MVEIVGKFVGRKYSTKSTNGESCYTVQTDYASEGSHLISPTSLQNSDGRKGKHRKNLLYY